jgi:ADP-glucose pyrophosphorylase
MLDEHIAKDADLTVSVKEVPWKKRAGSGS